MDNFVDWLIEYKELLFGGIGIALLGWLGRFIYKLFFQKKLVSGSHTQTMRSGDNSTNIQVGRDFNIMTKKNETDVEQK